MPLSYYGKEKMKEDNKKIAGQARNDGILLMGYCVPL